MINKLFKRVIKNISHLDEVNDLEYRLPEDLMQHRRAS